ncbi:MAG: YfhO family protein [bacterium]|nr:YfhO family protein [bacterium]
MDHQTTKPPGTLATCIYILPALGLFIYLFHPLFWSSVIDHDMTTYFYYFYKKLFFSELHNGELPLWNPGVALGYYQAGNPLHGYFYPLNIIFFLLPFDLAYNWLILIHYFLAGLFMYLLVKTLTGSPPASLFAGVTYAFSGVMISLSKNIGFLFGAVWYPLILFSIEKYMEGNKGQRTVKDFRKYKYFGLLTLGFCCQFLTGDLQSFVIGIGLAVIQLVVRIHQLEPIHKAPARFALSLGRAGLFLVGSLALAMGIAMIQLLPLLDMAWQSYRLHGIPLEEAGYFSFNPQRWINLFHPFIWGQSELNTFWGDNLSNSLTMKQFWYPSIYLGIAPIFLALCSIISLRQNQDSSSRQSGPRMTSQEDFSGLENRGLVIWYFVLILVFFFLACGSFTPVWPWVYSHLPVFSLFRFPAKYFSIVNLLLCVLAGLGLANLISRPLDRREFRIIYGGLLASAIAIFTFLGFRCSAFQAEIASHLQIDTTRALSELRQGYILLAFFSTASFLLIFLLAKSKGGKNYLLFALFLLLGIDIFLGLTPLRVTNRSDFHRAPEIYSRILSQEEPHSFRIWFDSGSVPFFRTRSYREVLVPNSALDDQVDYFFGNEPAVPGRTYELYRFDNFSNLAEFINLADTRYILTNVRQSGKPIAEIYPRLSGLTPVFADPEKNVLLLRNETARPRFYVVNQWEWIPSGREVLQRMFADWADPAPAHWPRAFLEANECLKSGRTQNMEKCWDRKFFLPAGGDAFPKQIKIIRYSPNRIDLEVHLPSPGLLVFNDSYYPGWQAQADGQDKEIYRTNYLFKGIFLSDGEHRVSFIFRPASYRWGKWITLFCLGGILLTVIGMKIKGRPRPARAGQNRPGRAAPTKT